MTNRDIMAAILSGEHPGLTPQWTMAFFNVATAERLLGQERLYAGYGEYPDSGAYPFAPMGEDRLAKECAFNQAIERCAFPVGWGANAAFGHAGPGEFNKTVIEAAPDRIVVQYETGAKREIRSRPHNVHMFDFPVNSDGDLEAMHLPDPTDPARYAGFADDVKWAKAKGEWTVGWINGFFSAPHYFFRDFPEFLADMAGEPEFAKAIIRKSGEWSITAAIKMCEAGVDCIGFCDDLGSQQSMLISPEMYREFIWPWHKRLCDTAHEFGASIHMHSHGAIVPVLGLLADAGIDMINPADPDDKVSLKDARKALGKRPVICGGMDKNYFDWPRERQVTFLKETVAEGRRNWPHILMDSGGIPENVSKDDFDFFLQLSHELRHGWH